MYNQAFRRFRWSSRRKMQRSKEEKQRWRSKFLPQNREICLGLTGLAVFLSFFLSFQTWGFFSFHKPRCLVYKDQKDCTDINVTLMATLYHTTCSGLWDEYTRVHGRAKPSRAILSSQGFRQWTQTQNSTVHMHRKEKGCWKEQLTHFPTYQDRCCSQGVVEVRNTFILTWGACLVTPAGWHLSTSHRKDVGRA